MEEKQQYARSRSASEWSPTNDCAVTVADEARVTFGRRILAQIEYDVCRLVMINMLHFAPTKHGKGGQQLSLIAC